MNPIPQKTCFNCKHTAIKVVEWTGQFGRCTNPKRGKPGKSLRCSKWDPRNEALR